MRFYVSELDGLLEVVDQGGLVVFPSAPVMVRLEEDEAHRLALEGAQVAVTDSAYMVLLWLLRTGERVKRISGLRFLRAFLERGSHARPGESFWVMPTREDALGNAAWLKGRGFEVSPEDAYVAPLYPRQGALADPELLARIRARRPRVIVIALSGGVQERLGWHLRCELDYQPVILCIGGAIAFLSGRQTAIPVWADRLALGWLLRFLSAPASFARKVKGVGRLAPLIWRFGSGSVVHRPASP